MAQPFHSALAVPVAGGVLHVGVAGAGRLGVGATISLFLFPVFLVMIIILLARPRGLFGKAA